jgi:hypothetical protein
MRATSGPVSERGDTLETGILTAENVK